MKILASVLLTSLPLSAAVITQWDFNFGGNDTNTTTGISSPATGSGTSSLLATTTASFTNGSANGGSSDPNTTDNSAWGTLTYPAATAGDLTGGVQFLVDTTGYENLTIKYDLRHSNTSSRHEAVQYTLNGTTWNTATFFSAIAGDVWFNGRSVDLSAIALAGNNPNFGIRIVSAFDSTATGSGASNYVATSPNATYATSGTWRFDMVTVSGTLIPEPASAVLGSVALLGLLRRRR